MAQHRWQKGQSGNPLGRRSSKPMTDAILAEMAKPAPGRGGITKREAMVVRLCNIVLRGPATEAIAAWKALTAYSDGLPTQPINLEIRRAAEEFAARTGGDPDWLVKRAAEIAQAAGAEAPV